MKRTRQPPTLKNRYYSYLVAYCMSCLACAVFLYGTVLLAYKKDFVGAAIGAAILFAQVVVNIMGYSRVRYLAKALKAQKRSESPQSDQ